VDEYVRVGEAPFLELDEKEIGHHLTQNLPISQVVHESFPLDVEHARAEVRPSSEASHCGAADSCLGDALDNPHSAVCSCHTLWLWGRRTTRSSALQI